MQLFLNILVIKCLVPKQQKWENKWKRTRLLFLGIAKMMQGLQQRQPTSLSVPLQLEAAINDENTDPLYLKSKVLMAHAGFNKSHASYSKNKVMTACFGTR